MNLYINDEFKVRDYLKKLSNGENVDFYRVLIQMSKGKFREVNAKKWQDKVYEVYFKDSNRLFFLVENGTVVLLYACRKTKNKTTKKDSKNIMKRYRLYKRGISSQDKA